MKAEKVQSNQGKTAADVVGSFLNYVEKNEKGLAPVVKKLRAALMEYQINENIKVITKMIKEAKIENKPPVKLYIDIERPKGWTRETKVKRNR